MLWGRAAGRCEFSGCNRPLSFHSKTKEDVNLAEAAHIIGFSEDGPRGEEELSEELGSDISNLMLLCRECHKTIDANRTNYPVGLLRQMKEALAIQTQELMLLKKDELGLVNRRKGATYSAVQRQKISV